ncbi:MAG: glutamyl-tRNA reductase [Candidatus Brocadiia bacterium]|jgi:glutamyl-tRNA reductase
MTTPRTIQVVGLSHHTAPVEMREALAFPRARLPEALASMRAVEGVEEVVILSTCNRVEVYVCARAAQGDALVRDLLTNFHGLSAESFERHLYTREGMDAVAHLFRVAAGLDSMVLGEAQVTAQVKAAYELAAAERTVGRVFHRLFQHSLSVAKRVRTSTDIDSGRASVGSVAVQLAQRIFETLADRTVLLIGAGQIGEVVLRSLHTAGAQTTLVANRTFSRADALARECGGTAVHFEQLPENLARADIVISSTDAPHYVIHRADVENALRIRRGRSLFLIDIAVPRDIEPSAAELPGCYLYNVDDLQLVVEETISRRKRELTRCLATVDEETAKFMRWARGLEVAPTIVELRDSLHELKRQELSALLNKYPDLPVEARVEIERTADRLVNKILHQPIKALQEPSSDEHGRGVLAAARRLFGLEQPPAPPAPPAPGPSEKEQP